MAYSSASDIEATFDEFWNQGRAFSNTAMFGLADIWEGPVADGSSGVGEHVGNNTVMAVETYKDNVYVLQGGGTHSWLKVVTPDGIAMYDIGDMLILMTDNMWPPYFCMTVLNEHEVIAGYLYLNLKFQYMAPFGIDMADLYRNPSFNISNSRANKGTWVTGVRDISGWHLYVHSKTSPDNCLPCSAKKSFAKGDFSCVDIDYSRPALEMPGYRMEDLSYSQGISYGARIPRQSPNLGKCMKAINDYAAVFNHVKISPDDLGNIGMQVSNNCSSVMYKNMVVASEFKAGGAIMADTYLDRLMGGNNDIAYLIGESVRLTGIIGSFIKDISSSLGDNDFTRLLIQDTVWWAPIWFSANQSAVGALDRNASAYSLLRNVTLNDFIMLLLGVAGGGGGGSSSTVSSMGWVVVGKSGTTPTKMGKNNMTYFRFPGAQCISVRKIGSIDGALTIDGIAQLETRANGIVVWAWKYHRIESDIIAYFISNDGVLSEVGRAGTGPEFSPVSGAAMAASDAGDKWIVKDYYLADFGSVEYVEITVNGGSEMETLKKGSMVSNYANVNEIIGAIGTPDASYYGDGTLEQHQGRFGLDSNQVTKALSWGNDGKQYSFIAGYSGLQIKTSDRI